MRTPPPLRAILELAERERRYILAEVVQVKGLMPILMKRRNRQTWTREDIAQMRVHLKRLSKISPYLVVLVMPGGLVILPVLAWWLDRRRGRRAPPAAAPAG